MNNEHHSQWLAISLKCPENILEPIIDILGVLSGSGVEQTPVADNTSTITAFFNLRDESAQAVQQRIMPAVEQLFSLYDLTPPAPQCSLLDDQDWATSWQQFFKPFAIIPGLVIKPSWEDYMAEPGEQIIEMDPGRAFGTGQHASTKMALALIHRCCQNYTPEQVLDVGTGTGILAMAAVLFGAKHVVAIDNDPVAVQVATDNIAANNLTAQISCFATDLADIDGQFSLICANIIHDVLVDMAPDLTTRLTAGGHLVLAGILRGKQEANIASVYAKLGTILVHTSYEDEWASLLLKA